MGLYVCERERGRGGCTQSESSRGQGEGEVLGQQSKSAEEERGFAVGKERKVWLEERECRRRSRKRMCMCVCKNLWESMWVCETERKREECSWRVEWAGYVCVLSLASGQKAKTGGSYHEEHHGYVQDYNYHTYMHTHHSHSLCLLHSSDYWWFIYFYFLRHHALSGLKWSRWMINFLNTERLIGGASTRQWKK